MCWLDYCSTCCVVFVRNGNPYYRCTLVASGITNPKKERSDWCFCELQQRENFITKSRLLLWGGSIFEILPEFVHVGLFAKGLAGGIDSPVGCADRRHCLFALCTCLQQESSPYNLIAK